jgi:hypothetical protein
MLPVRSGTIAAGGALLVSRVLAPRLPASSSSLLFSVVRRDSRAWAVLALAANYDLPTSRNRSKRIAIRTAILSRSFIQRRPQ